MINKITSKINFSYVKLLVTRCLFPMAFLGSGAGIGLPLVGFPFCWSLVLDLNTLPHCWFVFHLPNLLMCLICCHLVSFPLFLCVCVCMNFENFSLLSLCFQSSQVAWGIFSTGLWEERWGGGADKKILMTPTHL